MNEKLDKDKLELEKIIDRCDIFIKGDFDENNNTCRYAQEHEECCYKLFFKETCYCKYETTFNETKAIKFAEWLRY